MKDQHDRTTGDLLTKSKKRGRPIRPDKPSNTHKTIHRRAKIRGLIETGTPNLWNLTICAQIMGMKKYEHFHMTAWKRYGELKEEQNTYSSMSKSKAI